MIFPIVVNGRNFTLSTKDDRYLKVRFNSSLIGYIANTGDEDAMLRVSNLYGDDTYVDDLVAAMTWLSDNMTCQHSATTWHPHLGAWECEWCTAATKDEDAHGSPVWH